jgi:chromosome segregation ATPase
MKPRSQVITADGFDTNVAEKMPKIRKLEESPPLILEEEHPSLQEDPPDALPEMKCPEKPIEKKGIFEAPKKGIESEQTLDVLRLIEDLHDQLLASSQVNRVMEMDLTSHQKTIHQFARDNQELRHQLETLNKEHQRLKGLQSESAYLQEENADALERIKELHQALREAKETLNKVTREKEAALNRVDDLEAQIEQNEVIKIKGKFKEKEASLFSEENKELRSKLEETLAKNMDLEKKYESLKKSFHEVKESLTLLRDSYKTNYYNLSEKSE